MTTVAAAREDSSAEPSAGTTPPKASSSEARQPEAPAPGVDAAPGSRAAEQPDTGASAESAVFDVAALPQALKIVGAVVAPTTLLTGLLYYFGRVNATGYFGYFGVQVSVLDLTVQDYLIRGVDGMVVPLIAIAGITLLALWIYHLLLDALPAEARQTLQRVLMPSAAIAGSVLVSVAMVDLLDGPLFWAYPEVRGLSLSIGVLLLVYAAQLVRLLMAERRPERAPRRAPGAVIVAEWGAVFILVSVGLYWAVGNYAIGVGRGNAYKTEAALQSFPDVVAYSEKTLSLRAPGVREVACQYPDEAYRFRYDGLKLVQQSGNQYLFLPAGWTHANGAAILIPRSEALRLEFSPAGQVQSGTC